MRIVVGLLAAVVVAVLVARWMGARRWAAETQALRAAVNAGRLPQQDAVYDPHELDRLPPPVQRYLRAVLTPGQPIVRSVHVTHRGTFNSGTVTPTWSEFTSTQLVVTQRPGFDWDARIAMMPLLPAHVHDAYVAGEGVLHVALGGLVSVANARDRGTLAEGELMRFLAEATWYPTALLPSQGVHWEALTDSSARATLTDGARRVSLTFGFTADDLVSTVRAESRVRGLGEDAESRPWQGRFWNYERQFGMRIPMDGEVAWILPDGEWPYWRGRLTTIRYE